MTRAQSASGASDKSLLEDFIHYVLVARFELAADYGMALFNRGLSDSELALLIEQDPDQYERFKKAIEKSLGEDQGNQELTNVASTLRKRFIQGQMDLARSRARIEQAIQDLVGNRRQELHAEKLLKEAGEYAVPMLLNCIENDAKDPRLPRRCERVIRDIGLPAVTPLCVALQGLDTPAQARICSLLGEIGWAHATPYLHELLLDESVDDDVRDRATEAYRRVGGRGASLSDEWRALGWQYYDGPGALLAFPDDRTNNVWSWDDFAGLVFKAVPTQVFGEVMAMQMSLRSLDIDSVDQDSMTLFVAANLRRENRLPEGESDIVFGDNPRTPQFYATIFGTSVCQNVLALAIDDRDTQLIRDAIQALRETTGGVSLLAGEQGRQPLAEVLLYPDRRVRYESALVLAAAMPRQSFAGDFNVVPTLASAVRVGAESYAIVIADDAETGNAIAGDLRDIGFNVLGVGRSVDQLHNEIINSIAVDLVVTHHPSKDKAMQAINGVRAAPRTEVAPIIARVSPLDRPTLNARYRDDLTVSVLTHNDDLEQAVEDIMNRAAGGRMTEAEARRYAADAIVALKNIAVSNSPVYHIRDAESSMLEVLAASQGGMQLLAAEIVSWIDTKKSQVALLDAALVATEYDQIELLDQTTDSVKRFGCKTEQRQLDEVTDLVEFAEGDLAEAAARLYGACNLDRNEAVRLLPDF